MDAGLLAKINAVKESSGLSINTKTSQILELLQQHGHLYTQVIKAPLMLVHPVNRCGMLVNSFDSHEKGWRALSVGFDIAQLEGNSICTELSHTLKDEAFKANENLVKQAEGRLASVTGMERYCSLGSSHMSQFVKAVLHGCKTEHEDLSQLNECLSMDILQTKFRDHSFVKVCSEGWTWKVISAAASDTLKWLPSMVQASANSSNLVAKVANEIEVATSLAYHYEQSRSMELAVETTKWAMPLPYIKAVGHYVANFAGGEGFPLIRYMSDASKMFNSSLLLGAEFMDSLAYLHLKGMKEQIKAAEELMKMCWDLLQNLQWMQQKRGVSIFAKMQIRTALFLCKKSGKWKETRVFQSLQEIQEVFTQEVEAAKSQGESSSGQSHGGSMSSGTGASGSTDVKVMSLQDTSSPASIAMQQYSWLKENGRFLKKDCTDIHVFMHMDDMHGVFKVTDVRGNVETVRVPHKDLKFMKATSKEIPILLDESIVQRMQIATNLTDEVEKCNAFLKLHTAFQEQLDMPF
ncbi:unnamed protein product [Symbiodinium necroappetens]|uniref:Uncharacterized protein n=1 Tax=Symbiodinium necroappetens TaxID=1628268 RepID=A0A812N9T7_9DINO|nr:unnamed protein product [Symbiodinium necroappetens]